MSYTLTIDEQTAIDQAWFDALHNIDTSGAVIGLSREMFTVLGPDAEDLASAQRVFEKIPFNPDLRNKQFDTSSLEQPLKQLRELRRKLERSNASTVIKQAYFAKIDEVILNNEMMLASVRGDMASFSAINRQLYGEPDKRLFAAECAWLRNYAQQYISSDNAAIRQRAAAMLEFVPRRRGRAKDLFPRNATFRRVKALHNAPNGYFAQLLSTNPLPDYVTAHEGDPIVRNAIRAVGARYSLADSTDELWGVVHHQQQVVRPRDFRLPRQEFVGLVAHEVGSHLLERCNGMRQPLRLLQIGLDRYEAGNEGRAFLREQLVYDSPYDMQHQPGFEYIVLKHLAISLGHGLHQQPYNFKQLYETMFAVCNFFQILRQPDNPIYAETQARLETWQLLVRVLKGTLGTGGAYLKDIVYLEGNVRSWRAAQRNPAIILFGDNGKFDIARPEHLAILADIGLSPPTNRKPLHQAFTRLRAKRS